MKKICCIYCRVLSKEAKDLLDYQCRILQEFANKNDYVVIDVFAEVSNGTDFCSEEFQSLIRNITSHEINAVITYSKIRISVYEDLAEEFEMICNKHNVQLLTYK